MSQDTTPRSTGFTDTQLGMLLFIAAEIMFFGALASSYVFLRTAAESPWPLGREALPVAMATGTVFVFMLMAFATAEARRYGGAIAGRRKVVRWLRGAAGIAAFGAVLLTFEMLRLRGLGRTPDASNLFAIYVLCNFMLALRAVVVALWALWTATRLPHHEHRVDRVEGFAYYTHFIAVLSMLQFTLFYLV
jgi:heme/copper-type cytochrome/quinol oxidase subunit 3